MTAPEQPQHQTLSSYLASIETAIKAVLPEAAWLVAELSSFTIRANGTVFMDLVQSLDGKEVAKAPGCVMFANVAKKVLEQWRAVTGGLPQAGMKVLVRVRPNFSVQYGFNLQVGGIDPSYTLGDMQAKMREIIDRLKEQQIYDNQRELAAPAGYWRVAVVSPFEAAGLADFQKDADMLARAGVCDFQYFAATFQGESSSQSLREALRVLFERHKENPFDVVCVIRGGGAKTDLAWLNDFELARWVCRIPIPVFTGIGHQTDETILDLVAKRKFDTPSKVIGFIKSCLSQEAGLLRGSIEWAASEMLRLVAAQKPAVDRSTARFSASAQQLLHVHQVRCDRAQADFSRLGAAVLAEHRKWLQWAPEAIMRHSASLVAGQPAMIDRLSARFGAGVQCAMHVEKVACEKAGTDFARFVTRVINEEKVLLQRAPEAFFRHSAALCARQSAAIELASIQFASRTHLIVDREKSRLDRVCMIYDRISPLTLLAKGFALVRGPDGCLITSAADARAAGLLDLAFADGHVQVST